MHKLGHKLLPYKSKTINEFTRYPLKNDEGVSATK
jgi:hypothetical protein